MTTYSPIKHKEKLNYSIPTYSTTNHHAERIGAMSVHLFNFHNDGQYSQAIKCVKSRIITKVIDCVLSIDIF